MTIGDWARLLHRAWRPILLWGLAGGLLVGVGVATTPRTWAATTRVIVSVAETARDDPTGVGQAAAAPLAAQEVTRTYAAVATSTRVLAPVVDELGLPCSPAELAERVQVVSLVGSTTFDIVVTDTDPARGRLVADAVTRHHGELVTTVLAPPRGDGSPRVRFEVLDPATSTPVPGSRPPATDVVLGAGGGTLAGLVVAARRRHDTTRETRAPLVHQ